MFQGNIFRRPISLKGWHYLSVYTTMGNLVDMNTGKKLIKTVIGYIGF